MTTASSMARGSPARIVRPNTPPSAPVQASRDGMPCGPVSRRTHSNCTGTQLMPATSPKWATWADMAPANANDSAPRTDGPQPRRQARRNANIPVPAMAQVRIMFRVQAATGGATANKNVNGYAAPAFQPPSSGAPLQMYGLYSGR